MTVADYFKMNRIFDRRRIDKLRKVRRSRSSSRENTGRQESEDGLKIPDELEPVTAPTANAAAVSAPSSSGAAAAGGYGGRDGDADTASLELPRQLPASSSATPSPAVFARGAARPDGGYPSSGPNVAEDLKARTLDSEASDDVPCEGTFATGSGSRGRAWSEHAVSTTVPPEDHQFSDFECMAASEASAESARVPMVPGSSGPPRSSSPSTMPQAAANTSCVLCLVGDSLELMMAPGDVLAVKGQGRLTEIGTAHGMLGHVLLVLSPPTNVLRHSDEGNSLQAVWPSAEVEEIWRVRTVESTRSEHGLHEAEMLLYVDRATGQLILIGELQQDGTLVITEHEPVELWQSPAELRFEIRIDLMARVLSDMKDNEASWSHVTVVRAISFSAKLTAVQGQLPEQTMDAVRQSWKREPICTSVVIIFWQRYLCELAAGLEGNVHQESLDLMLRWMPLKADRGLPGDLLGAMRSVGWVTVAQVPRIFRPMVFTNGSSNGQRGLATPDADCEARVMAVAREVATGGA